jgi:hypothetical protein
LPFSAKNYCGDFDNDAAVMNVDQDLMCKFITFKVKAILYIILYTDLYIKMEFNSSVNLSQQQDVVGPTGVDSTSRDWRAWP